MKILKVHAREVLDSRGNPTVEAEVTTDAGVFRAMTPSGASAGQHEALELRDKDERYHGKGVKTAVRNVNDVIAPKINGQDVTDQRGIDGIMVGLDGTKSKEKLGANAILPVSMAVCRAGAAAAGKPLYAHIGTLFGAKPSVLPTPMCNVINGGKHAGQENSVQEHMLMPTKASSFREAIRSVSETYHHLRKLLKDKYGAMATLVGDEGGFAPTALTDIEERFALMLKAAENAGCDLQIALDPASSEFFDDGTYRIGERSFSAGELVDFYTDLVGKYPIVSIEDGLAEDDWEGWVEMTRRLGGRVQIVGDDIFVTSTDRIRKGIEMKAANSVLIKLNQIGSVSETFDAMKMAFDAGWTTVVSHRSGETEDSFIADFVVGTNGGQIKTGAPARSDRNAKYNQLIRIEEQLGGTYRGAIR